jgi:5-methyltetrahydrofolate--homocysteine methyltransferase
MQSLAYEINAAAARIAKEAIQEYEESLQLSVSNEKETQLPSANSLLHTHFVAGALGPMNKTLSLRPDVNDPGFRAMTFR